MKVLIISSDMSSLLAEAMKFVIGNKKTEAIIYSHEQAMTKFVEEEPKAVIILDYIEGPSSEKFPGLQTYNDLKASATDERIIRCGLDSLGHADYIKMPFDLASLKKILKGGKRNDKN